MESQGALRPIRSVAVALPENHTHELEVIPLLGRALVNTASRRLDAPLVEASQADLTIKSQLLTMKRALLSQTESGQDREREVVLVLRYEMIKADGESLREGVVSRSQSFRVDRGESEHFALRQVSDLIAAEVIEALTER